MLKELTEALAGGDYPRCCELADQLLAGDQLEPEVRAQVHLAACQGRRVLGDLHQAAVHARAAAALAREQADEAALAQALLCLGLSLSGQQPEDVDAMAELLALLPRHAQLRPFEGEVRYRLGLIRIRQGRQTDGWAELAAAHVALERDGHLERADEVRRTLLRAQIRAGRLEEAAALLSAGEAYVEARSGAPHLRAAHLLDQAEYALARPDQREAVRLALAALDLAGGHAELSCQSYMLLHRVARSLDDAYGALKNALLARIHALEAQLPETALAASLAFVEVRDELGPRAPEVLLHLQRDFRHHGVDIFQYLPESAFRRRDPAP